jgi:hypothetical protein
MGFDLEGVARLQQLLVLDRLIENVMFDLHFTLNNILSSLTQTTKVELE